MGTGQGRLDHIGQPDINGINIIRGDPWLRTTRGERYWGWPGVFYTDGWRMTYKNEWCFFAPDSFRTKSEQVALRAGYRHLDVQSGGHQLWALHVRAIGQYDQRYGAHSVGQLRWHRPEVEGAG